MNTPTETRLQHMESALKELVRGKTGRRALLKATPLLLAACASRKQTRYREGDNTGQAAALTVSQEQQMASEYMGKMSKDYPAVRDQQLQNYISGLGQQIVAANGLRGNPYNYSFTLVQKDMINAFALPAGTVMVTAPLFASASSEAELAGVIGHEIGHVQARHTAERMHEQKKSESNNLLYSVGGGLLGAALGYGVGKMICSRKDNACLQKAATWGAGTGAMGAMLISKYGFMQNSQEDELEADRIGFRTSVKAGFDRNHVGGFYKKMLAMEQKRKGGGSISIPFADSLSTHPPSQQRVDQMAEMAAKAQGRGKVSGQNFAAMQQRAKRFVRS